MRAASTAVATGILNSRILRIVCKVALIMRGPPEAPTTISGRPLFTTIVGDMLLSGRLWGWSELAWLPIKP